VNGWMREIAEALLPEASRAGHCLGLSAARSVAVPKPEVKSGGERGEGRRGGEQQRRDQEECVGAQSALRRESAAQMLQNSRARLRDSTHGVS
jgi:hypothetical protein